MKIQEQIAEVKRELVMRQNLYPDMVSSGKLSPALAKYRIEAMEAIVETLKEYEKIIGS